MTTEFDAYVAMQVAGADPVDVYRAARSNGVDQIASIRMLREVYSLSLDEAKKIGFKGDTGTAHDAQEGTLVDEFTKVLDDELGLD